MLCGEVERYIAGKTNRLFFFAVGDDEYRIILDELITSGLELVRFSDFCRSDDRVPSVDDLVNALNDTSEAQRVIVGVGECAALMGREERILRRLLDVEARGVLLLRCCGEYVRTFDASDMRGREIGRYHVRKGRNDIALVLAGNDGMKALLHQLEDGASGLVPAGENIPLGNSSLNIHRDGAYEALRSIEASLPHEDCGTPELWALFLNDYNHDGKSITGIFASHGINETSYAKITADEYDCWLYFLYLKANVHTITNTYLQAVVERTEDFRDLQANIMSEPAEGRMYDERKEILKSFPEAYIAELAGQNGNSISLLTDNTLTEREAIIRYASVYGMGDNVRKIYPALGFYMDKYIFSDNYLTEYFDRYKQFKLMGRCDDDFLRLVERYAVSQPYNKYDTRDNIISSLNDSRNFLLWIDALGVEYVSYIKHIADMKGMNTEITITRSNLPTITSINRKFFDDWPDTMRQKDDRLDDIKHDASNPKDYPAYLARELEIIDDAIDSARAKLTHNTCSKFIITGDHGASRLALTAGYIRYDCAAIPEHSGRCCEYFDGCEAQHMAIENGYIVLTDYGRFKGGRAAGNELHGGGTLEEVLVPVAVLTLKRAGKPAEERSEFSEFFK